MKFDPPPPLAPPTTKLLKFSGVPAHDREFLCILACCRLPATTPRPSYPWDKKSGVCIHGAPPIATEW